MVSRFEVESLEIFFMFLLKPNTSISNDRRALLSDSLKVRPMAITSPTDFICVERTGSVVKNFSKVNRGIFTTQ